MTQLNGTAAQATGQSKLNAKSAFQQALGEEEHQTNYAMERETLLQRENDAAWDSKVRKEATGWEREVAEIVFKIREYERDVTFGNIASEDLPGEDTLDMGGQFLTNKRRIEEKSDIFKIAKRLPKGAIQHLHFNAELHPEKLLQQANTMPNMFIQSKRALLEEKDLDMTEVIFNVLPKETASIDIFSADYRPEGNKVGPPMLWNKFRRRFENVFPRVCANEPDEEKPLNSITMGKMKDSSIEAPIKLEPAERWIKNKMVLNEQEAYGLSQTVNGVWARFNQATRCFKGLFNYKQVFEWYISSAIDAMIDEGIMYAELRPMLMDKAIPTDDGHGKLDHDEQMDLILACVAKKQKELKDKDMLDKFRFGLKIIYCTPRSIPKPRMQLEMQDCIQLKLKYPELICGFDLVGAEDRANHIGHYYEELVAFTEACKKLNIEIPFLFHAGETLLDTGGSKDPGKSNLFDAALLNSKRIGHGFSLMKHPELVEEFKRKNICIELCPISNELLHLCRNVKEHPFPQLLAAGIPCSVNSDNPSLFSNSMSHEFYQVMVGAPSMSLYSWKQLALWSIEYSCLTEKEQKIAKDIFDREWETFCGWVKENFKDFANTLDPNGKPTEATAKYQESRKST
jgi:adenosine deaminase CECR1